MRRPFCFAVLALTVLALAVAITYRYGLPLLNGTSEFCESGGLRTLGCGTKFGTFMTLVCSGVAVIVGIIWSKLRD